MHKYACYFILQKPLPEYLLAQTNFSHFLFNKTPWSISLKTLGHFENTILEYKGKSIKKNFFLMINQHALKKLVQ